MAGLPIQFDLQAGLDLSSLSSVTQAQLMQSLNQMAPLSNVGGIIVFSNRAGADWPSTALNPRFARYIWLDTYQTVLDPLTPGTNPIVFKLKSAAADIYSSWAATSVQIASVVTSNLATPVGALNGVPLNLLKRNADGSVSGDTLRLIITDQNGQYVIVSTLDSYLTSNPVPLNKLVLTGAGSAGSFLKGNGGSPQWLVIDGTDFTDKNIATHKLTPGSSNQVLTTNASNGFVEFQNISAILQALDITLDKLGKNTSGGAAGVTNQHIRFNGSQAFWTNSPFLVYSGIKDDLGGVLPSSAAGLGRAINHNLGVIPSNWKVTLVSQGGSPGYDINDELELDACYDDNVATKPQAFSVSVDINSFFIAFTYALNKLFAFPKAGGAVINISANTWKIRVRAWTA